MAVTTMNFETVSTKNEETCNNHTWLKTATMPAVGLFLPLAPGQMVQLQQAPAPVFGISRREATIKQALAVVPAAPELLKSVREGFGFNITELAQLFAVTRPTIYSWLKNERLPKPEVIKKLNTLNTVAAHWKAVCKDEDLTFLLDYTGSSASEPSIRESLPLTAHDAETLKALIDQRLAQYLEASAQSSKILGEKPKLADRAIPRSAYKLNSQWARNTKTLKAAQGKKI